MIFFDLPDDLFMLAMCVREEHLKVPTRWCSEMRAMQCAIQAGPKTAAEAERLMAMADRLAGEASAEHFQLEKH